MAIVKCLMMQRDEAQLLEPWLRYHGYLFGFENLTVFDNGSVLPDVIETLRRYETIGVHVYWDFAGQHNFEGKSFHFTNVIEGFDFGGGYDFAIPVDCDEFLAVLQPDELSCKRTDIHRALDALIGEQRALGIEFSMFNIPGRPGCYRPQLYSKGFFACGTIKSLDHCYHYPAAKTEGRRETELTYLHYHHKPFELLLKHARRKLEGLIDLDRPETAVGYTRSGNHLIRFLTMTEEDYLADFDRSLMIRFDALEQLLGTFAPLDESLFGVCDRNGEPRVRDGEVHVRIAGGANEEPVFAPVSTEIYYRLNPDVAAHRIEALKHYFQHGYAEGRPIRSEDIDKIEQMA